MSQECAVVGVLCDIDPTVDDRRLEWASRILYEARARFADVTGETDLAGDGDTVGTTVARTIAHDLTIAGATREGFFEVLVVGVLP